MTKLRKKIMTGLLCFSLGCVSVAVATSTNEIQASAEASPIQMLTGASARIDEHKGIRFGATVSKDLVDTTWEKDNASVEMGMLIMPADYLDLYGELTTDNVFGENAIYSFDDSKTQIINLMTSSEHLLTYEMNDNLYVINGSIVDIKDNNLDREFTGRAYAKLTTAENAVTYIWADYQGTAKDSARSIVEVADKAYETYAEDDTIGPWLTDTVKKAVTNRYNALMAIEPTKENVEAFDAAYDKVATLFNSLSGKMYKEVVAEEQASMVNGLADEMFAAKLGAAGDPIVSGPTAINTCESGYTNKTVDIGEYASDSANTEITLNTNGGIGAIALDTNRKWAKNVDVQQNSNAGLSNKSWVVLQDSNPNSENRIFLPAINFSEYDQATVTLQFSEVRLTGFSFRDDSVKSYTWTGDNESGGGTIEFAYDGEKIVATATVTHDYKLATEQTPVVIGTHEITDEAIINGTKALSFSVWNNGNSNSRIVLAEIYLTTTTVPSAPTTVEVTTQVNTCESGYTNKTVDIGEYASDSANTEITLNTNGGIGAIALDTNRKWAKNVDVQQNSNAGLLNKSWVVLQSSNPNSENRIFLPAINFSEYDQVTATLQFSAVRLTGFSFSDNGVQSYTWTGDTGSGGGTIEFAYDGEKIVATATVTHDYTLATAQTPVVIGTYEITDAAIINGTKALSFSVWNNGNSNSRIVLAELYLTVAHSKDSMYEAVRLPSQVAEETLVNP